MGKVEFHIFKRNTDAIATNKGFYYQYLKTIKLWLDNFVTKTNNEIYCEREDDIFELSNVTKTYNFHQIKCYSEGSGLNSEEIKSSLLNFYNLYLKYKDDYNGLFYFETNTDFKKYAGKSLEKWYNKQKKGDYSPEEFVDETRTILIELVESNLKKYLKKEIEPSKIKIAKAKVETFTKELLMPSFSKFLAAIRWEFAKEINTSKAILLLLKEIKQILSSDNLHFDKDIDENLLLGYILNTVVEKSTEEDENKRVLNNEILQKILNLTNLEDKIAERLRPDVIQLMQHNFIILDKLDNINKKTTDIKDSIDEVKALLEPKTTEETLILSLTNQVKDWFFVVDYKLERYEKINIDTSELIINISARRGYDRIFILCVSEVVELTHLIALKEGVDTHRCKEGWIVTYRRISKSVREKVGDGIYKDLFCYTIDELIDENTDFSEYFEWIENEVISKNITDNYIPLNCKKDVFDKENYNKIDTSDYIIEEYVDQWIDDPTKNHISVLGEFGTGKTWFTLHYAWIKLQEYKDAKDKGLQRPRIPILVPLRDFAKAVSIEGVFSEFFFNKHNSPIPTYSAFEELNKMGKLLLIFDGFDEMADKVDSQKMINNFWELAKTITENSKVILTCRNEHFPEAKQGRELLSAELQASTQHLIAESPQFEVLELLKFNDKQIEKLLTMYTDKETVTKIMSDKNLLDLARRPVMIELILESLTDIEDGKPIDISRVYLYAIKKKFTKDIKEERTFTSIADKLYFMCELSWEMLSTNNMSINYRLFPERIRELFSDTVQEEKDIDHWQYDMMGQTLLIRNDDGDYKPAHRSFLEFFVAYKFAAELGILDHDFTELALSKNNEKTRELEWTEFFINSNTSNMSNFKKIDLSKLKITFGKQIITRAILDLIKDMISINTIEQQNKLNQIIKKCKNKDFNEVGYIVTNIVMILTDYQNTYFIGKDLSNLCIRDYKLPHSNSEQSNVHDENIPIFIKTNFSNSDLSGSDFDNTYYRDNISNNILEANFTNTNLENFKFYSAQVDSFDYLSSKNIFAIGSPDNILILNFKDLSVVKRLDNANGWSLLFSPNGKYFVHSGYGWLYIRNTENFEIEVAHELSEEFNSMAQEEGTNLWTGGFTFSKNSKIIYLSCSNAFVYSYDIESRQEINTYQCVYASTDVALSYTEHYLASSEYDGFSIWDLKNNTLIKREIQEEENYAHYIVKMHPLKNILGVLYNNHIRLYDILLDSFIETVNLSDVEDFCFSSDGKIIYAITYKSINIINLFNKTIERTYKIKSSNSFDMHSSEGLQNIILSEEKLNLYLVTSREVIVFNITLEKVVDTYSLLYDMEGIDFTKVIGINDKVATQLKRYGAIIE